MDKKLNNLTIVTESELSAGISEKKEQQKSSIALEELLRLFIDFNELKGKISQDDRTKAINGDLQTLTMIAEIYWNGVNGNDIQVDRYSAVNLLNYCHEKGYANATADLAIVKLSGEFGPIEKNTAIDLLKEAASQGCESALKKLNEMNIQL